MSKENGPKTHEKHEENVWKVVWCTEEEVENPKEDACNRCGNQHHVEEGHEQEVESDTLTEVVPDLVDVGTRRETPEPIFVHVQEFSVLMKEEIVRQVPVMTQRVDVHPGTIVP